MILLSWWGGYCYNINVNHNLYLHFFIAIIDVSTVDTALISLSGIRVKWGERLPDKELSLEASTKRGDPKIEGQR